MVHTLRERWFKWATYSCVVSFICKGCTQTWLALKKVKARRPFQLRSDSVLCASLEREGWSEISFAALKRVQITDRLRFSRKCCLQMWVLRQWKLDSPFAHDSRQELHNSNQDTPDKICQLSVSCVERLWLCYQLQIVHSTPHLGPSISQYNMCSNWGHNE